MRVDIDVDPRCMHAVKEVYLNDELLKACYMADDQTGVVKIAKMDKLKFIETDYQGDVLKVLKYGRVKIVLAYGWEYYGGQLREVKQ
jgi:hypothetical protein